jgi:hypothetical protein
MTIPNCFVCQELMIQFIFTTIFPVFTTVLFCTFSTSPPLFSSLALLFAPPDYNPRIFFTPNRQKQFGSNPATDHHGASHPLFSPHTPSIFTTPPL